MVQSFLALKRVTLTNISLPFSPFTFFSYELCSGVRDPDPDPHVFGPPDPDPLVGGVDPDSDPDPSFFS